MHKIKYLDPEIENLIEALNEEWMKENGEKARDKAGGLLMLARDFKLTNLEALAFGLWVDKWDKSHPDVGYDEVNKDRGEYLHKILELKDTDWDEFINIIKFAELSIKPHSTVSPH